ncbi:MAG: signal peptidase I [Pirellulales bacterium]|nr:signal peptidase I [Pirellulales bacterium]
MRIVHLYYCTAIGGHYGSPTLLVEELTVSMFMLLFAQFDHPSATGSGVLATVTQLALVVFGIIGLWKTFVKAGKPGWASIIPIYNIIVLCQIAGKPGWWVLLLLIPIVNLIILILVSIDVAKNFGHGVGFGLGLAFLGVIFSPILGLGDARYQKVV